MSDDLNDKIPLELTRGEALALFDMLADINASGLPVRDSADRQTLANLLCLLESLLVSRFDPTIPNSLHKLRDKSNAQTDLTATSIFRVQLRLFPSNPALELEFLHHGKQGGSGHWQFQRLWSAYCRRTSQGGIFRRGDYASASTPDEA